MATGQLNTFGRRRKFRGRRALPGGLLRSSENTGKPNTVTYERGQKRPYPTKHIPAQFKVQMPRNRRTFIDP